MTSYTNSLVNTNLFYANFANMQFEKRRQELEDTLIKLEMLRGNDYEEVIRICTNETHY